MIITVLWEDRRGVEVRQYGPHELLVACVADNFHCERRLVTERVEPVPRKGNGGVVTALRDTLDLLRKSGPVFAVIDRDQAHAIWKPPSPLCVTGIRTEFTKRLPGDYDLVLLDANIESVVNAACKARGLSPPPEKPTPEQRDELLKKITWGSSEQRANVLDQVPSFGRLVTRVTKLLTPIILL